MSMALVYYSVQMQHPVDVNMNEPQSPMSLCQGSPHYGRGDTATQGSEGLGNVLGFLVMVSHYGHAYMKFNLYSIYVYKYLHYY